MRPAEAVEGVLEESIFAQSGLSLEAFASVGASEKARRQRYRVHEREGRVVWGEREGILPEALLYLPEVGGLTGEGGTVDVAEGREPLGVVPSEEEVESLVSVEPQELSDDLYGEHLCIGEVWGGAALAQGFPVFELVVNQAEDGRDEGAKIHKKTSVTFGAIGLTPSVGRSSLWLKSSRETCTRG